MTKIKTKAAAKKAPKRASFVPETSTVDHGHEYPVIPVRPPFLLVYNPQRWTIIEGRVVPQLHTAPLMEGVNGVTRAPNGAWRLARLKDQIERLGRTVIPWSEGPDGSYIDEVDTRLPSGAVVSTYISTFATTFAGSEVVRADLPAYVEWLESLMKAGTIPSPPPYVIEKMQHDKAAALVRAKDAYERSKSASDQKSVKALENEIKQLSTLSKVATRVPAKARTASIAVDAE